MTSELRPAVDVWVQAEVAYEAAWEHNNDKGEQAAAAVIEADREAVRAEQATELAKFKALAETLAGALEAGTRFMPPSATVWHREAAKALREYKEARDGKC